MTGNIFRDICIGVMGFCLEKKTYSTDIGNKFHGVKLTKERKLNLKDKSGKKNR